VAALLLALVALLWLFQRRLVYFPLLHDLPPIAATLPGAEEAAFETEDGLRLRGWYLPAPAAQGRAVLLCNGNAGDRSFRAPLAAALARRGYAVLLFDYRGYGGNPGRPSEAGLLADARAARAYLASRPDVDASRLAYLGESLGAAVALALAVERPPAALVLRSPFTTLGDVGRHHYPFLPVFDRLLADRYPSVEVIGRLRSPLLVVVGERDQVVPPEHSRRLYEAAPHQLQKQWVLIPGADHNDRAMLDGERFIDAVSRFLDAPTAAGGTG
jgi:hypothetical protein